MAVIASIHNPRVKLVRQLQSQREARESEGLFVAEGARLADDFIAAGLAPVLACVGEAAPAQAWLRSQSGLACDVLEVNDAVMRTISLETTPPGVLAVFPIPARAPDAPDLRAAPLILILDGLRDPGNLGACLRVAAGADCRQVVLTPGSVDLYNPKVVRGGMGAHARLSAAQLTWDEVRAACAGRAVWAAAADGDRTYDAAPWRERSALAVGAEAAGVSRVVREMAAGAVRIPLANGVESLNAAVACGVILFEAARQRRAAPPAGPPGSQPTLSAS
jgi:TrmH family RNA methyltransferase